MTILIRRASLAPFGTDDQLDVRLTEGRVSAVGRTLDVGALDQVIDAHGGTLMPGIHDHHVHLRALSAACASIPAGPPEVADAAGLARRLQDAARSSPPGQWVRAVGYHEAVAGDLDRWALDRLCPHRPLRVQHATGELWMVNSAGLRILSLGPSAPPGVECGVDGQPTGRIWREDRWLRERLGPEPPGRAEEHLRAVSRRAAALGITGFTDATCGKTDADAQWLADRVADDTVLQRLHLMTATVVHLRAGPLTTLGPVKIVLDDPALPSLDALAYDLADAHARHRPVAIHCVTAVQAVVAIAALELAGALEGDRIEHGAVLPRELVPRLARLGITVVTQPAMVAARADRYLADIAPCERADLWRLASLMDAGVHVAAGSDAPHGPLDPWRAIADAVGRRSPSGAVLGPSERVPARAAVRLFVGAAGRPGAPRSVAVGQPADLVLLGGPLDLQDLEAPPAVRCTFVAGRSIYDAEDRDVSDVSLDSETTDVA